MVKLNRLLLLVLVPVVSVLVGSRSSLMTASDRTTSVQLESVDHTFPQTTNPTRLASFHVPPGIHNIVATPTVIAGATVTVTVNLREPSTRDGTALLSQNFGSSSFRDWTEKNFRKGMSRIIFQNLPLPLGCGSPGSNVWLSNASQYRFALGARLKYWDSWGSAVTTVIKFGNPVNVLKYVPSVSFVSQIYRAGRRNYFRPGEDARHDVELKQKSCGDSRIQINYQIRKWDSQTSAYLNYYPGTGNLEVLQNPVTVKHGTTRAVFSVRIPASTLYQYRISARAFGTNQKWVYGTWVSILR